ncbi:hypothetical protein [Campylobacter concisus]
MQWINLELANACFAVIGKDENYLVNICNSQVIATKTSWHP